MFAVEFTLLRRLRSGAKSVDHQNYPSATVTSAASLGVRDSKCDYAVCSSCGFQFCIKCLCEYHPETVCPDLAPNSPSKEEDRGQPNVACSRQSRRSLQRLCRKL
uniref:IBR domain-containing protein n=1 Tax=Anopheles atroparvus TaxID=41427 RepID=A0A182INC3_ANOAO